MYDKFCLDLFLRNLDFYLAFLNSEAGSTNTQHKTESCKHQNHEGVFVSEPNSLI